MDSDGNAIEAKAAEIERDFDIPQGCLAEVLRKALSAFREEERFVRSQQKSRSASRAMTIALQHVETALKSWRNIPKPLRADFENWSGHVRPGIANRLQSVIADIEEYIEWYPGRAGNNNRSRAPGAQGLDIMPLVQFANILRRFWTGELQRKFGHEIYRDIDAIKNPESRRVENIRVLRSESEAIRFVRAAGIITGVTYDLATYETVMRGLKKGKYDVSMYAEEP